MKYYILNSLFFLILISFQSCKSSSDKIERQNNRDTISKNDRKLNDSIYLKTQMKVQDTDSCEIVAWQALSYTSFKDSKPEHLESALKLVNKYEKQCLGPYIPHAKIIILRTMKKYEIGKIYVKNLDSSRFFNSYEKLMHLQLYDAYYYQDIGKKNKKKNCYKIIAEAIKPLLFQDDSEDLAWMRYFSFKSSYTTKQEILKEAKDLQAQFPSKKYLFENHIIWGLERGLLNADLP